MPTISDDLVDLAPLLRESFVRCGYDADTLLATLGGDAHAALGRGEAVPVRRALPATGEFSTLVRLLLIGDPCPRADVEAALAPLPVDRALAAGLLAESAGGVEAALDVRPIDMGSGNRWLFSDLDDSMRRRDTIPEHVLGVGHASLSLLQATPPRGEPVAAGPDGRLTVLDIGTGCGVQAVHARSYADSVTATDISERAILLARAGAAINRLEIEFHAGSWFEPVAGRTFDRVVANPPFVVGSGDIAHVYRDSGLDLDGASRLMLGQAADHLNPGGIASMLAAWVHVRGEDWRARVSAWLPDHGVEAWIVQRDVADPALYVGTWMRDAGLDPRDPEAAQQAERWLAHFERAGVEGIGFGFVYLQRTDEPTSILAEDLRHGFSDPLGPEAVDYLRRAAWLRQHSVVDNLLRLDDATALERVYLPATDTNADSASPADGPWRQVVARLHRGDGPAWQHEVDELGLAIIAGLSRGELPLWQIVDLLATAHGIDADELLAGASVLVESLLRHGLLRPAA
ncbi:N5-glutamine methyltransferase family protein [Tomitella biformata]|uniref:N5-glutamine methyltransferase family protein n=1 Tax=Tomitella biformata TaxID=630403 RepID=UPI00056F19BC|nr:class I SAM-dependent methyltransferase [Tomitella biformata]